MLGVASSIYSPAEQHGSSFPEQPLLLPPAPPAFPKGKRLALSLHKLKMCGGGKQWWLQFLPPQIAVGLVFPTVAWQPEPWIGQGGRSGRRWRRRPLQKLLNLFFFYIWLDTIRYYCETTGLSESEWLFFSSGTETGMENSIPEVREQEGNGKKLTTPQNGQGSGVTSSFPSLGPALPLWLPPMVHWCDPFYSYVKLGLMSLFCLKIGTNIS